MPPREGLQKDVDAPTGQTGGATNVKLTGHTHTTPTQNPLGVPFQWGADCTRQGRKAFLTWGPPVKVKFELATPNSVHGCTLARPTWRRMIYWAGVHCARAVHVQVVCTYCCFGASTGQTVGTGDAKLAGHMHTASTCVPLWLTLLWGASCARQGRKAFLTWGPPVKVKFELATPNSVHGCTLARPTWRRMIYWAGVHCARAVHVQVVCTYCCFGASTGQTVGTGDAKLAGHMHTASTCVPLWLTLLWGASCARQRWKTFLTWGPPVYGESKL